MSRIDLQKDGNSLPTDQVELQIGPSKPSLQHPMKLTTTIDGERIVGMRVDLGYTHSGFEKAAESLSYNELHKLVDGLNPSIAPTHSLTYIGCLEKLAGIVPDERSQYERMTLLELARIASHTHSLNYIASLLEIHPYSRDLSSRLKILRDSLADHFSFTGISDEGFEILEDILILTDDLIDIAYKLTASGGILYRRLCGKGAIEAERALDMGWSGPNLRASGINYDLRKHSDLWAYYKIDFDVPIRKNGDSFDRCSIRVSEMEQSRSIIEQCLKALDKLPKTEKAEGKVPQPKPESQAYFSLEAPEGELGYLIASDKSDKPRRLHIRPPGLAAAYALSRVLHDTRLENLAPVLASLNIGGKELER